MSPTASPPASDRAPSGVTLFEVLAVAAIAGVIAAVAVPSLLNSRADARDLRLVSTVAQLNQRLGIYYANGGSMSGLRDPQQVIDKLKNRLGNDACARFGGYPGATVDSRLRAVALPENQIGSNRLRATWNSSLRRFETTREPVPGVGFFARGNRDNDDPAAAELAKSGANSEAPHPLAGSDSIPEPRPIAAALPIGETPEPSSGPAQAAALQGPEFSRLPGIYPVADFPILLSLRNPNPPGTSRLLYRIGLAGDFVPYSGESIAAAPGDRVYALAESTHALRSLDSHAVGGAYEGQPVALKLRLRSDRTSYTYFDLVDGQGAVMASVANLEQIPSALREGIRIRWVFDGGDPEAGQGGTNLAAQSIPLTPSCWGREASMAVTAVATGATPLVTASEPVCLPVEAAMRRLGSPVFAVVQVQPGLAAVSIELPGRVPDGCRIYFRTDGLEPVFDEASGEISGTAYEGPFPLLLESVSSGDGSSAYAPVNLVAKVFPPPDLAAWFACSSPSGMVIQGECGALTGGAACQDGASSLMDLDVSSDPSGGGRHGRLSRVYSGLNPLALNRFDLAGDAWVQAEEWISGRHDQGAGEGDPPGAGRERGMLLRELPWDGLFEGIAGMDTAAAAEVVGDFSGHQRGGEAAPAFRFPFGGEE